MPHTHQGKNVRVRDARDGDPGFVANTDQVVVTYDDNTQKTCTRGEVVST